MPVIRHEAERDQPHDKPLGRVEHSAEEADIVFVAVKDPGLSVPTVHDVLRHIVGENARSSRHEPLAVQNPCQATTTDDEMDETRWWLPP